jgi:predicted transcriptional regulator
VSDEEREYLNEMIRSLNNRLVDALRERDEARRELCRIESSASGDPNMTSRAVAADLGWNCYKEDGK